MESIDMLTRSQVTEKVKRDLEYFEGVRPEGRYCIIKTPLEKLNQIRIGKIAFKETEERLGKDFTQDAAIDFVANMIHDWMLDGKMYACADGFSRRHPVLTYLANVKDWLYAPFKRWYLINVILKSDKWKTFKKS